MSKSIMVFEKSQLFAIITFLYLIRLDKISGHHSEHLRRCILNPYYDPVCGTDMRTYANRDILDCLNLQRPHSRQIHAIYSRECSPLICPSIEDLQGSWPVSSPVCGNNGHTYGHIHQLRCLREHFPGIRVLHEGGCNIREAYHVLGRNAVEKACTEERRHFEVNPVCTSHNRTYPNPFEAICHLRTLPHEKFGGICGSSVQRSCDLSHRLQRALISASGNERLRHLVCGSDLRTYRSEHHLECSRQHNPNLYLLYHGRCRDFTDICPEKLKTIQTASPICGTDNFSYTSIDALICARYRMNKNINFLHTGACLRN